MKFFTLFFFVTFVTSFDFDFDSNKNVVSDVLEDQTTVVVTPASQPETTTSTTTTTTTTVTPASQPNTTASTTTTTTQEPLGREVPSSAKKETTTTTKAPEFRDHGEIGGYTSSLEPESSGRVQIVVTQSIFRLIDEAFRERLINFESRIAALLGKREEVRDEIDAFTPSFEENFFNEAFADDR